MDIGIKRVIGIYQYVYMFGVICVSPAEVKFRYYRSNDTHEDFDLSQYIVDDVVKLGEDELFQLSIIDKHIINVIDMIKELKLDKME